jgi:hypothetical protein
MYASATRIAGHLLTIDDCRFLVAIDQKNKDLQSVILALPDVSRISARYGKPVRTDLGGRSDARAGFFSSSNARLSTSRVLQSLKHCRMNVRLHG